MTFLEFIFIFSHAIFIYSIYLHFKLNNCWKIKSFLKFIFKVAWNFSENFLNKIRRDFSKIILTLRKFSFKFSFECQKRFFSKIIELYAICWQKCVSLPNLFHPCGNPFGTIRIPPSLNQVHKNFTAQDDQLDKKFIYKFFLVFQEFSDLCKNNQFVLSDGQNLWRRPISQVFSSYKNNQFFS